MARVFAAAMADDPLSVHVFPDRMRRGRALLALYEMIVRLGVRAGAMRITSPAVEGLALWDRPGRPAIRARHIVCSGAIRFLRAAGPRAVTRLARYEAWAATRMQAHAPRGCAHLLLLSVDPAHQGRGWASRLLRPTLEELDARGIAACLETQNPANVPIYRHLGFRTMEQTTVRGLPVSHWVMVRPVCGRSPV
jgi:GNAT superfamily N-acetyltransferase